MFSRVVSNFRKKAKSTRKSLKTSISSPEIKIKPSESHSGRAFSAEFDFDCGGDCKANLGSTLSICDNVSDSAQNKRLDPSENKLKSSDSGANHYQKINMRKLPNLISITLLVQEQIITVHFVYLQSYLARGARK